MNKKIFALLMPILAMAGTVHAEYVINHTAADIGSMTIDFIGYVLQGLIDNATTLVTILIITVIVGLLSTLLAAVFGIFNIFRKIRK